MIDRQIAERVAYKLIDGNSTVSVRQAALAAPTSITFIPHLRRRLSIHLGSLCARCFSYITGVMVYCCPEIVRQSRRFVLYAVGGLTKQLNGPAAGAVPGATCINAFKQADFRCDLWQRRRNDYVLHGRLSADKTRRQAEMQACMPSFFTARVHFCILNEIAGKRKC